MQSLELSSQTAILLEQFWLVRHQNRAEAFRLAEAAAASICDNTPAIDAAWARFAVLICHSLQLPNDECIEKFSRQRTNFLTLQCESGAILTQAQLALTLRRLGKPDEAWEILSKDVEPFIHRLTPIHQFMAYLSLFLVGSLTDDIASLRYCYEGLAIARQLNDQSRIALSLGNIAESQLNNGNFEDAIKNYLEVYSIARNLQLKNRLSTLPFYLALAYIATNKFEQASEIMAEWINDWGSEANDFTHIQGLSIAIYLAARTSSQWPRAQRWLQGVELLLAHGKRAQSDDSASDGFSPYRLYWAWAKGSLLRHMGQLHEAVAALHAADVAFEQCEVLFIRVETCKERYLCHKAIGNLPEALKALESYSIRQAHLLNRTNTIRLLSMNITHALETEKLHRQKAEESARLKSEFLANMSHEIRTPMNAVLGLTHLALQTPLSKVQLDYLTKIQKAGNSLLGLINDILDFSKIEAGKLDVEAVLFSLDEVLSSIATITSQKAFEKRIEFIFNVHRNVPRTLVGDPLRLGQILINLVNNAIKFTEPGGEVSLEIAVSPVQSTSESCYLHFSVRDNGIGISEEQQSRLFTAFSQADSSTTRRYGGTGLGLSISHRLVQLMGGNINVTSTLGSGSTFRIELQFPLGHDSGDANLPSAALPDIRVLVVDDSEYARTAISDMLEHLGATTDTAPSGAVALQKILNAQAGQPFDLLLTDWRMPEMDGLELVRRIHESPDLKKKPRSILASALSRDMLMQTEIANAGIDATLFKPVGAHALRQTLHDLYSTNHSIMERTTPRPSSFKETRILLAEDNAINQQITVELLGMVDIHVDVAEDGEQVLQMASKVPKGYYGMILMDLQMPAMDGHAATRHIRALPHMQDTPIVALTAHAISDIRERCLTDGMQDFLTKPIYPDRLFKVLDRWIGKKEAIKPPEPDPVVVTASMLPASIDLSRFRTLDHTRGLHLMGNKHHLYVKLLKHFYLNYADTPAKLRGHWQSGRFEDAGRLIHTLKGIAGSMCAAHLVSCAEQLENHLLAIGQVHSNIEEHESFAALSLAINSVLDEIALIFPSDQLIVQSVQ